MIRIAVADDDKECTRQLCQYIDDFARESGQNCDVTVYHDGDELVERYKAQDTWKTDTVFEKESFDLLQNILEEAGELPARVPYEDLVVTDFARAAVKE